jgi:hypothetical protein
VLWDENDMVPSLGRTSGSHCECMFSKEKLSSSLGPAIQPFSSIEFIGKARR